jgi:hypothetical protein
VSPSGTGKPPSNLDIALDRTSEVDGGQAREAKELAVRLSLDRPQSPSVALNVRLDPLVDHGVALLWPEERGEVPHDLRVAVQVGERLTIMVMPAPEPQALGLNRDAHSTSSQR